MKPQQQVVVLNAAQRQELTSLLQRGACLARTQNKARILLLCDRSRGHQRTDQQVAEAVLCHSLTVLRTRQRFIQHGLQGALYDKSRPGAKPKISGEVEAHLVALAFSGFGLFRSASGSCGMDAATDG